MSDEPEKRPSLPDFIESLREQIMEFSFKSSTLPPIEESDSPGVAAMGMFAQSGGKDAGGQQQEENTLVLRSRTIMRTLQ